MLEQYMFDSENKKLPTELLGRYKDSTLLGKGGMGLVFIAKDTVLEKLVVVKTLPKDADNKSIVRFQKEAQAAAKLQHANIVTALDFGITSSGVPYLIMEYVEGQTLSEKLSLGSLSIASTLRFVTQVSAGLNHAHHKGVLHRDIKPSNIMLDYSEGENSAKALIIDFGIASLRRPETEGFFSTGSGIVGSPAYMAPEVGNGAPATIESEIYSLGCVTFECLTGKPVFSGESALDVIKKHIKQPVPQISDELDSSENKNLIEGLENLINKCLEKDPLLRYRSFDELKNELFTLFEEIHAEPPIVPSSKPEDEHFLKTRIPTIWLVGGGLAFIGFATLASNLYSSKLHEIKKTTNSHSRTNEIRSPLTDDMNKGVLNLFDEVVVGGTVKVTDESVIKEKLPGFEKKSLNLSNSEISDRAIKSLEGKEINHLDLSFTKLTISSTYSIEKINNLTMLELKGIKALDDNWLKQLGNLKHLRYLWLDGTAITDKGIQYLTNCKTLFRISFAGCKNITDKGIASLNVLPLLESISVSHTNVSFEALSKLGHLKSIHAAYGKLSDEDIKYLKNLEDLEHLKINGTQITDRGLFEIGKLKNIRKIQITDCVNLTEAEKVKFKEKYPDYELIYFEQK